MSDYISNDTINEKISRRTTGRGSVYLVQPAELVGCTPTRYKIGCSKYDDLKRILEGYRVGTRTLLVRESIKPFDLEDEIKKRFNAKFKLIAGTEYFEGNENDMIKEFNDVVDNFVDNFIDNGQDINNVIKNDEMMLAINDTEKNDVMVENNEVIKWVSDNLKLQAGRFTHKYLLNEFFKKNSSFEHLNAKSEITGLKLPNVKYNSQKEIYRKMDDGKSKKYKGFWEGFTIVGCDKFCDTTVKAEEEKQAALKAEEKKQAAIKIDFKQCMNELINNQLNLFMKWWVSKQLYNDSVIKMGKNVGFVITTGKQMFMDFKTYTEHDDKLYDHIHGVGDLIKKITLHMSLPTGAVVKGERTKYGQKQKYNIEILKKHFKVRSDSFYLDAIDTELRAFIQNTYIVCDAINCKDNRCKYTEFRKLYTEYLHGININEPFQTDTRFSRKLTKNSKIKIQKSNNIKYILGLRKSCDDDSNLIIEQ